MKQQNNKKIYNILAAIISIVVLIYFGYQEEFIIYKEECVKEIQEIGLDYYNEESYGENYNITSYEIRNFGFYKLDDDFCIDYISSQTNKSFILMSSKFYDKGVGLECIGREITLINKNYYNISSKIEYLISVEKTKEIFPELNFDESKVYIKNGVIYNKNKYFWVMIETIRNKSVCEKVEVEEIEICHMEYDRCIIGDKKCKDKDEKVCEKINKKDLTKEWLSQNCEMGRCTICEDLRCKNQKCDLFYCGDYEVELK